MVPFALDGQFARAPGAVDCATCIGEYRCPVRPTPTRRPTATPGLPGDVNYDGEITTTFRGLSWQTRLRME